MENSIVIYGYMASGKSTIGPLLATQLQLPYLDLDDQIELHCNMSITDIFKSKGELFFRKIEHEVLKEVIKNKNKFVLAVGGGTPCYYNNHLLIENAGYFTCYLNTSPKILAQRIIKSRNMRPILSDIPAENLPEYIAKHLFDRNYFYMRAMRTVVTDQKLPQDVVAEIMSFFKGFQKA